MEDQANKKRQDHTFSPGDWVLLRLQPYRQHTVVRRSSQKLSKRYYGPYAVRRRIGAVAYELELPPSSRIHPVVHVSLLKPYHGDKPQGHFTPLPTDLRDFIFEEGMEEGIDRNSVLSEPQRTEVVPQSTESTQLPSNSTLSPNKLLQSPPSDSIALEKKEMKQSGPSNKMTLENKFEPLGACSNTASPSPAAKQNAPALKPTDARLTTPHVSIDCQLQSPPNSQNLSRPCDQNQPTLKESQPLEDSTILVPQPAPTRARQLSPHDSGFSTAPPHSPSTHVNDQLSPTQGNPKPFVSTKNQLPAHNKMDHHNIHTGPISSELGFSRTKALNLEDKVPCDPGSIVSKQNSLGSFGPKREIKKPVWLKDFIQ